MASGQSCPLSRPLARHRAPKRWHVERKAWQDPLARKRAGFGYEHQQTFGGFLPDGTPIGNNLRNTVSGAADYTLSQRFKLAAQAELRFEQGIDDEVYDALVRDVFSEHWLEI